MNLIVNYELIIVMCCIVSVLVGIKIGEYYKKKEILKLLESIKNEEVKKYENHI